jgi:cytochrome c oxidase subunit 2
MAPASTDARPVRRCRSWRLPVVLLVVDLSGLVAGCSSNAPSVLRTRGTEAHRVASLWWLMFGLAAAVYVIVSGFIVFAILRGRRTETGKEGPVSDSTFIWWGGIIVPVGILMVLAWQTVSSTHDLRRPSPNPLRIEVVGKRWWWDVTYPDLGIRTANEIHVPVGQPLDIGLDSDNVIHSFWLPQLAGKEDTIPGQHNTLRFTATQAGTYRGLCAQYCGIQHARMDFLMIVDPPDVFGRWVARNQLVPSAPDGGAAAVGQVVFMREPCAGCHTIRGTQATATIGPDLTNFGSRMWIGSITIPNTPGNLAGWVANSQSVKPGNLMPPISLSPTDLNNVVAYLESLK